jgi:hypothetical protein
MSDETKGGLVVVGSGAALTAFEPHDLASAMQLADVLSRSKLIPGSLRNPADILIVVMTGRELGLTVMQSVRGCHVIDGKVGMSAELMLALVKRRPECKFIRIVESTDIVCTLETQRDGDPEPTRMSYSIEQAKRAGVTNKDNWKKHTEAMLRARCASALCRAVYPDLLLGVYSEDEMDEIAGSRRPARVESTVIESTEASDGLAADIASSIMSADSIVTLEALVPAIQASGLPASDMKNLRAAYGARKKALQAQSVVPEATVVDADSAPEGE